MNYGRHTWALVLAAGEGSRLRSLTTDERGIAVPKQFCSLRGGPTLLLEAMRRGHAVAPRERICVIVAEQHRRWWQPALWPLPAGNVIVQPKNRGTANGILLSLLSILERDPLANIVFIPSDHYVEAEELLAIELRAAASRTASGGAAAVLLGIQPDEADPELGYIVPGAALDDGHYRIERFVEKPHTDIARGLIAKGGMWNSFIFSADGNALLSMFRNSYPSLVDDMATALARSVGADQPAQPIREFYAALPDIDFSRHIVEREAHRLSVRPVPRCGWSDLGTPQRVGATLRRLPQPARRFNSWASNAASYINLATMHAEAQMAG
jgi:mannose-1-phosphate guanylyltransferase